MSLRKQAANDPNRFHGDGVMIRGKLIGITDVPELKGDKMCFEAMQKLKADVLRRGEHKQRIFISISVEGVKIRKNENDKMEDLWHHHEVKCISFIWRDPSDARAFGYVTALTAETKRQFIAIKTERAADQVIATLKDLFQVIIDAKQKEATGSDQAAQPAATDGTTAQATATTGTTAVTTTTTTNTAAVTATTTTTPTTTAAEPTAPTPAPTNPNPAPAPAPTPVSASVESAPAPAPVAAVETVPDLLGDWGTVPEEPTKDKPKEPNLLDMLIAPEPNNSFSAATFNQPGLGTAAVKPTNAMKTTDDLNEIFGSTDFSFAPQPAYKTPNLDEIFAPAITTPAPAPAPTPISAAAAFSASATWNPSQTQSRPNSPLITPGTPPVPPRNLPSLPNVLPNVPNGSVNPFFMGPTAQTAPVGMMSPGMANPGFGLMSPPVFSNSGVPAPPSAPAPVPRTTPFSDFSNAGSFGTAFQQQSTSIPPVANPFAFGNFNAPSTTPMNAPSNLSTNPGWPSQTAAPVAASASASNPFAVDRGSAAATPAPAMPPSGSLSNPFFSGPKKDEPFFKDLVMAGKEMYGVWPEPSKPKPVERPKALHELMGGRPQPQPPGQSQFDIDSAFSSGQASSSGNLMD